MVQKMRARLREKSPLQKLMLLVLIVRLVTMQFVSPYILLSDTSSYVNFSFAEFFRLIFQERTPVYPLIIRVCYLFFGEVYFYQALSTLQCAASIISVIFLYKAVLLMFQKETLAFWVALIYGCSPTVYGWDYVVLTESFALSGAVIFLYLMMRYLKTPTFKIGVFGIIWLFILTFLRPTFLLFDGILLVFWVLRWIFCKEERRQAVKLFLCSCGCFAFIGVYAAIFYNTFGFFSISNPMPRQYLYVNIERGYYLESGDDAYIETVQTALETYDWSVWTAVSVVREQYTDAEIIEITDAYIDTHLLQFAKDSYDLFGSIAEEKFLNYYAYDVNSALIGLLPFYQTYEIVMAPLRIGHMYLLMIAELVVAIALWIKRKEVPWLHLGLATFLWGIVCTSIIATCGEYPRTMIAVLPFAYLSIAGFISWLLEHSATKDKPQLQ